MMGRVQGKIILVTGGVGDIGESICKTLASHGAKVAIADIADGRSLEEEINAEGFESKYWPLDVTNEDSVRGVVAQVLEKWGRIDVLVNNAGISGSESPTEHVRAEEWDEVMAVNVRGVVFCVKHIVPVMRKGNGGSIINISSVYGTIGSPRHPAYHASKGALKIMTKTDALSYYQDGIRVNVVSPGLIETSMLKKKFEVWNEKMIELQDLQPLGLGKPEDVAYAVLYLASDESRFMTGGEILIDGGYSIW